MEYIKFIGASLSGVFISIIIFKYWMAIANRLGELLGIGRVIRKLLDK